MRLTPAHLGLTALALALLTAALVLWRAEESSPASSPSASAGDTRPAPVARSLRDTVPDGDLQAMQTAGGAPVSGALAYGELRRLFDYYLSTVGEQSVETITAQIQAELQRRLSPLQAQRAQRLLGLYLAYKRELVDLEAKPDLAGNVVAAIRRRMLAMQDLRSHYFSADEAEGMFGFEDAYDLDAVARLEIDQDTSLNAQQKKQRLAALDAAMAPTLRQEREASYVVANTEQQVQALRAKGATDDEVYRLRAQAFDPQAAARLADVDREEAAWKSRIAQYQDARARLLQTQANASASERQASLAQLQESLFSAAERPRLVAYE